MPSATKKQVPASHGLQPGAVRAPHALKNSQAHPGVSPLQSDWPS